MISNKLTTLHHFVTEKRNLLKHIYILFTVLIHTFTSQATEQISESFHYNGEHYWSYTFPLKSYPKLDSLEKPKGNLSSCWRGYVGTWKIRNDSLFLKKLSSPGRLHKLRKHSLRKNFSDACQNNEVFASWYKGDVTLFGHELELGIDQPIVSFENGLVSKTTFRCVNIYGYYHPKRIKKILSSDRPFLKLLFYKEFAQQEARSYKEDKVALNIHKYFYELGFIAEAKLALKNWYESYPLSQNYHVVDFFRAKITWIENPELLESEVQNVLTALVTDSSLLNNKYLFSCADIFFPDVIDQYLQTNQPEKAQLLLNMLKTLDLLNPQYLLKHIRLSNAMVEKNYTFTYSPKPNPHNTPDYQKLGAEINQLLQPSSTSQQARLIEIEKATNSFIAFKRTEKERWEDIKQNAYEKLVLGKGDK